jgi:hypothetical protein
LGAIVDPGRADDYDQARLSFNLSIGWIMQLPLPKPKRWPLLVVIALIVVFVSDAAVQGQRGPQPPRPGPPPGQPQRQPGQPGRPFQPQNQPFVPVPQPNQRHVVTVTVWSCSRCNKELGRGPVPPPLATCPNCGCVFAGNPMRVAQNPAVGLDAWLGDLSPNFLHTVGIEASLLGGMVLVGIVRLATQRPAQPALPMEGESSASG